MSSEKARTVVAGSRDTFYSYALAISRRDSAPNGAPITLIPVALQPHACHCYIMLPIICACASLLLEFRAWALSGFGCPVRLHCDASSGCHLLRLNRMTRTTPTSDVDELDKAITVIAKYDDDNNSTLTLPISTVKHRPWPLLLMAQKA